MSSASNRLPGTKSSYCVRLLEKPLPDHQDHAALVAEQAADREADQHHQHRQVEEQVAGLAQVAPLGATDAVVAVATTR